jgi:asparagine synthase (glutamine-hydrolysing)
MGEVFIYMLWYTPIIMCGVVGIIQNNKQGVKINVNIVNDMLSILKERGPDDSGVFSCKKCILGQTRLSIVDLETGHQPMEDTETGNAITYNGEIYNYKELRDDLIKQGHKFSTNSDTEVILKLYAEYGAECVEHLDGMFAFVIWNEKTQELIMARDRFGKKPLYYTHDNDDNLIITSEIKALFQAGVKGEIDHSAIDNYLALMYIPPWKSVYKNIYVLPPAYYATYTNGKLIQKRYWKILDKPIKNISYEDAKKHTKELLRKAVEKRMVADVEIGALLSGGVDSTLISVYAQQSSRSPLKTFSIGYAGHEDETPYAKEASDKIGAEHHTLQVTSNLMDDLEKVIEYMDEPHADSSNFPQHIISELASSKVKVALSGDGADELFMGYGWHSKYWNVRKIVRIKNALFSNQFKEHLKNISVFRKSDRKKLWKDTSFVNDDIQGEAVESVKKNDIKKINLFDLTTYLPGQLLTKIDRTSMMHSLEIRSPFLDYKLAEYVYNLPLKYKMNKRMGKIILKDILSEIMPKEFVYRRKQGFGAPIVEWLKTDEMKVYVHKTFDNTALIYSFLKKDRVIELINRFYSFNDESVHYQIWTLLCLEIWMKSHNK